MHRNIITFFFVLIIIAGCTPSAAEDKEENEDRNQDEQDFDLRQTIRPPVPPPPPPPPVPPPEPEPSAPTIAILQPDGGEVISTSTFTVEWRAADQDTPTTELSLILEYQREGGIWIRFTDYLDNDGMHLWDVSQLAEGTYRIRATVTDGEKETTETTGPFVIGKN